MKYQILLITLLMGVALAFPVPDEEVSPGSAAAAAAAPHIGEIKSEVAVDKPALKTALTEETKTKPQPVQVIQEKQQQQESKKIEEEPKLKVESTKVEEKQPILGLGTPDSELTQNLPEQQKPIEIKEKEKNIRSENLATEELKSLPSGVIETHNVVPSAVEKQQQIVDEEKPVLQVILPEDKIASASSAVEDKESKPILLEEKTQTADAVLPSSEAGPTVDSVPAPAATIVDETLVSVSADESKKVDLTGRQERGGNEAKKESVEIISELPASSPAEIIKDDLTTLKALEPLATAEKLPMPEASAAASDTELKPKIEDNAEELKSAPVGDIEKLPASLDENENKIKEITENKESTSNILPEGKEIETDIAKEAPVIKPDAILNETAQPLITSEPKDSSEEKKDSIESKESAESEESKSKSDENVSN